MGKNRRGKNGKKNRRLAALNEEFVSGAEAHSDDAGESRKRSRADSEEEAGGDGVVMGRGPMRAGLGGGNDGGTESRDGARKHKRRRTDDDGGGGHGPKARRVNINELVQAQKKQGESAAAEKSAAKAKVREMKKATGDLSQAEKANYVGLDCEMVGVGSNGKVSRGVRVRRPRLTTTCERLPPPPTPPPPPPPEKCVGPCVRSGLQRPRALRRLCAGGRARDGLPHAVQWRAREGHQKRRRVVPGP